MRFDLKKPCSNCPFLRIGGVRLLPARVREIAGMMLSPQGSTFACHKTTTEDDEGESIPSGDSSHCAGALIFAEVNGNATQMMRIAERLGLYKADRLMKNKTVVKSVFKNLSEMLRVNRREL